MAQGEPQNEYKDVSDNLRLFQTIRFAQLTVFMAASGALISVVLNGSVGTSPLIVGLLKLGGLVLTFLFWNLQERTMLYWRHFVRRASELEKVLGYQQYATRPPAGMLSSTNAIRGFFILMGLLWIALLVVPV